MITPHVPPNRAPSMPSKPKDWQQSMNIGARPYVCGHCGNSVSSDVGYFAQPGGEGNSTSWRIYICHQCLMPTFFGPGGKQSPGPLFGQDVEGIGAPEVANLYGEARACMTVAAYTAAALCSRKMLMNVAVAKGAKAGDSFRSYVEFLADKRLIPEEAKDWVKHIKDSGNDANHSINLIERRDAERLLTYVEMLLKLVYEFPARLKD